MVISQNVDANGMRKTKKKKTEPDNRLETIDRSPAGHPNGHDDSISKKNETEAKKRRQRR